MEPGGKIYSVKDTSGGPFVPFNDPLVSAADDRKTQGASDKDV